MNTELERASKLLDLSCQFQRVLGICPLKTTDYVCFPLFVYMFGLTLSNLCELTVKKNGFEYVSAVLEFLTFTVLTFKITILRFYKVSLKNCIESAKDDFKPDQYHSKEEIVGFLKYHTMTKIYFGAAIPVYVITTLLYYLRPLAKYIPGVHPGNVTMMYELPYRMRLPFEITTRSTYVMAYLFFVFFVPTLICGVVGTDSLAIILTFHVCGQLFVLTERVKELRNDPLTYQQQFTKIVVKHQQLIEMEEVVNTTFSSMIFFEMLGCTLLLCLTIYNFLANLNGGENAKTMTFMSFVFCVLIILFTYCFLGECLALESENLWGAFYGCEWYDMPIEHTKLILICMIRTQHPLTLRAGKFFPLSLNVFAELIKSAASYLSVLRTLI